MSVCLLVSQSRRPNHGKQTEYLSTAGLDLPLLDSVNANVTNSGQYRWILSLHRKQSPKRQVLPGRPLIQIQRTAELCRQRPRRIRIGGSGSNQAIGSRIR